MFSTRPPITVSVVLSSLLLASSLAAAPVKRVAREPAATQEPTAQIKLRDLLGLVPRGESPEALELRSQLQRLEELLTVIEKRLTAIEELLKARTPPPAVPLEEAR